MYSLPLTVKLTFIIDTFCLPLDREPFQIGTAKLEMVPKNLNIFCKYINLNSSGFHTFSNVMVIVSVNWNVTWDSPTNEIHGATAAWTENVTREGFLACVRVTMNVMFLSDIPLLEWLAFQINVRYRTGGVLDGGMYSLMAFTSGSRCTNISLPVSEFGCVILHWFLKEII